MKKLILLALILAVGGVIYLVYPKQAVSPTNGGMASPTPTVPAEVASFTLTQVAEHKDKNSCWIALEGKVYDVTPFIAGGLHPGKEAILLGCGKDATELYNNRPNGKGAHSSQARSMLPKYFIGNLAE